MIGNLKISQLAKTSKYAGQELGAGIAAPFAVIGYKGARWSIRHRGNTHVLERKDAQGRPDGFVPFLDLVILLSASHHSKVYYEKPYIDGSDDMPDCWSTDGVKPDQAAPKKQNPICANCRWNEFGSRMNQATGAKGKACADTRRMAVVPYQDIDNQLLGGPMLLRVPPASLGGVGEYSDMLKANSVPYSAIATRVGFDSKEAYPKMTFEAFAALTDDEMAKVIKMQDHPLVERIVQEQLENVTAQVGSEQGTVTPPSSSGPKSNGSGQVTTPVTTAADNPFTQVDTSGPSYAGQKGPVEGQQGGQGSGAAQQPTGAAAPAAAAQEQVLTEDQLKIRELEAKLAAATAGQPVKAPTRRRTQPVAPQQTAEAHTGPPLPAPVGPETAQPEGEETGDGTGAVVPGGADPALDSITARLSKILG
jgi:hypothetical protein